MFRQATKPDSRMCLLWVDSSRVRRVVQEKLEKVTAMEWLLFIVICFVLIFLVAKRPKKPAEKSHSHPQKIRAERSINADDEWEDVPFVKSRPTGKWAILPKSHNSKLVTIRDMADQKQARDNIVRAVLQEESVVLSAKREPDNPYDPNAIAVFGSVGGGQAVQAGYIDTETSEALAHKFDTQMPISVEMRSVRSNGKQVYIGLSLLVPIKSVRTGFEIM